MRKVVTYFFLLFLLCRAKGQADSVALRYKAAYESIHDMLKGRAPANFKKAVFLTENAYYDNGLSYDKFNAHIQYLVKIAEAYRRANPLKDYKFADSLEVAKSGSVFKAMKDSLYDTDHNLVIAPLAYDFDDIFAERDWSKMFVSRLLVTHKGNCHSLPFLYKILCEEQGVKAYLAYAPNHIYIKQRCKKDGWYNTELTSGLFPVDAWVMASGYVSTETIRNSLYMDTLSVHQSLAQCLVDLARGYENKVKENYYDFVLLCCSTALEYNPNFAEGLLYKAETLRKRYESCLDEGLAAAAKDIYQEMQQNYVTLARLGYREIPEDMYAEWINSLEKDRKKYENKKISHTFNSTN